jgi:hypothetical protein
MTMVMNVKFFEQYIDRNYLCIMMDMKKQRPLKRYSMIFLILGLAFLMIGLATDQTAFSWIAIAFVLVSLLAGGKWLRPRK